MRFLLDTSALLFWLEGSKRIGRAVRTELVDPVNRVYVSSVSTFEISVKASVKRLTLPDTPAKLSSVFVHSGLTELPVSMRHSYGVYDLPPHHADVRSLLISQALCEDKTPVTSDRLFTAYAVKLVLLK